MERHVLAIGVLPDSPLGRLMHAECSKRGLEPVFVYDWSKCTLRLYPDTAEFEIRVDGQLQLATNRTVKAALMFGYPRRPTVEPDDSAFQETEFDAMLFGLCMLAEPVLASRWSYIVSGFSDVQQFSVPGDEHPLVSAALRAALRHHGAREAVVYDNTCHFKSGNGEVRELRFRGTGGSPLEVTIELDPTSQSWRPFAGLLPEWLPECRGLLAKLLERAMPGHRSSYVPLTSIPGPKVPERGNTPIVVAHHGDSTAAHLLHHARTSGLRFQFLNLTDLYSSRCRDEDFESQVRCVTNAPFVFARAIFIAHGTARDRPQAVNRHFSLLRALQTRRLPTANRPAAGHENISKSAQLSLLASHGILVPRTIVTNDPDGLALFCDVIPRVVYKATGWMRSVTTMLAARDLSRIDAIGRCPTLFQEFIDGSNCRVHTVARNSLPLAIEAVATDYRFSFGNNKYSSVKLPLEMETRLLDVTAATGMLIGGCDLRWSSTAGAWYTLEINRMPAFDVFDHQSNHCVAAAILDAAKKCTSDF